MNGMRGRLDIRDLQRRFIGEGELGGLRHHQVGFDAGIAQQLQHPDAVDDAGRAGNTDD